MATTFLPFTLGMYLLFIFAPAKMCWRFGEIFAGAKMDAPSFDN